MPVALPPGVAETLRVADLLEESPPDSVSFSPTTRLPGFIVPDPTSKRARTRIPECFGYGCSSLRTSGRRGQASVDAELKQRGRTGEKLSLDERFHEAQPTRPRPA